MSKGLTTGHCASQLCERYAAVLGGAAADYADVFDCAYVRLEIRQDRLVAARRLEKDGRRRRADFRVLVPDFDAYLRAFHPRVATAQPRLSA
jgi:hypothetical protein